MRSDDGDFRDQLLKVSDFLNKFQSHFLPSRTKNNSCDVANSESSDETTRVPVRDITAQDLRNTLAFRSLLGRLRRIEEDKVVAAEYGRNEEKSEILSRQLVAYKAEEIGKVRKEIEATSDRTKLVFFMLQRCEVWTCKLVAQDQLLTSNRLLPEAARIKTDQCCFSTLLNIPSSKYFQKILNPIVSENKEQEATGSTTAEEMNSTTSKILIPAFHRHSKYAQCCSLALPPNRYTWEAYARLAIMASLIGDDELSECDPVNKRDGKGTRKNHKEMCIIQCLKSPCCLNDLNRHKGGKNPSQNRDYSFSPSSDLVPLWIRAQRNTQALRHLILLFEVIQEKRENNDGLSKPFTSATSSTEDKFTSSEENFQDVNGSTLGAGGKRMMLNHTENKSAQESTSIEKNSVHYRAIFRGNPMNVRTRVTELCEHVDHLIEWAVVNQSIFTYNHIKQEILTDIPRGQQKIVRKRHREGDDLFFRTFFSKRNSHNVVDKQSLFEIRQACHSYLLRWFARRNRNALTILFSKQAKDLALDIGCSVNMKVLSQSQTLRDLNISYEVQEYMQHLQNEKCHPEDRTFSRIDRRLFIPDRYNGSSPVSCRSQLLSLLKTFSEVCPENRKRLKKEIDAAIDDCEHMFQTFSPETKDEVNQDDVFRNALRLVKPLHGCTESSFVDLLKSAPAPWVEKCCKCKKSGPLRTCFNCERAFHKNCSGSTSGTSCTSIHLKDFIGSFKPLQDLLKLKRPENIEYPDFSTSESQWMKKTIGIERTMKTDGKIRKLGISFDHTEDCAKVLDAIESDTCLLVELMKSDDGDSREENMLTPARMATKGCLIREVHKELCGGRAGLQVGDIIIGVELIKFAHPEDAEKYGGPCKFDLSELSSKDRLALLKVESLKLNLIILRPPINVVEIATTWYNGTKRLNKKILTVLRGMSTLKLWYCGNCVRSINPKESRSVFLEAAYCRSVIRRIGMESYARPFLEGNQTPESNHFCLRRLDSMMTHIMRLESKETSYDYAPESFLAPSSDNSTPRRLSWASEGVEGRPMELLCESMKALVNASFPGKCDLNTHRSALLRHFLMTFSSWCVGSIAISNSHRQLLGPPEIFQFCRAPWFEIKHTTLNETCNNQLCNNQAARSKSHTGDIDRVEAEKIGTCMKEYSAHASLVGKSFLVLPSDPLVEYVSKIVHIEHGNRPVEFIVASFLPSHYHDAVVNGRPKNQYDHFDASNGIYHLLPVVSSRQQIFLLERCKMRNRNMERDSGSSWTSLGVLNLDGVARYSPAALRSKLKKSSEIRNAIDSAIIQKVCEFSSIPPNSLKKVSKFYTNAITKFSSTTADNDLMMQEKLLETLLKGKASLEAVRHLSSPNINDSSNGTIIEDENWTKWKIAQQGEIHDPLEFGVSRLQPGLLPINSINTSWKILTPQNISEKEYSLYYSDLVFENEVDRQKLENMIHPLTILPNLESPLWMKGPIRLFTFTQQNQSVTSNDMFGWGFEILKWAKESLLRVGRIRQGSPAFRVGLKTNDIIQSINGVRFTNFKDISGLVSSILGAFNVKVRIPDNLKRNDAILILLETIKSAQLKLSPVTIIVVRPLASSKIRSTEASGPEISTQHSSPSGVIPGQETTTQHYHQSKVVPGREITTQHPHQSRIPPQRNNGLLSDNRQHKPPTPRTEPNAQRGHSMYRFIQILENASRPQLQKWDFYRPAKNGIIFTMLEVSVFFESCLNRTWKLGVRLLLPRYDYKIVAAQIRIILSWTPEVFSQIPLLNAKFYQEILNLDCKRMHCESFPEVGPIVLEEEKDGITFRYRTPVRPLPIDRSIEMMFDAHQQRTQNQQAVPNHPVWHSHHNERQAYNNHYQTHQNISYPSQFHNHYSDDPERQHRSFVAPSYQLVQNNRVTPPQHLQDFRNDQGIINLVDEDDDVHHLSLQSNEPSLSIYNNDTNTNFVNSQSSFSGQQAERIRGGGNSDIDERDNSSIDQQSDDLYLCDVPKNDWTGKAVCTFVQTESKGSVCRDALLVGFARGFIEGNAHDEEILDEVEIIAYYLSSTGYLETAKLHQSYSDEVWVVNIDQDCEESRVIAKLHSQDRLPPDYQEESQRSVLRNISSDNFRAEDDRSRNEATLHKQQACATDSLRLDFNRTPYICDCENEDVGVATPIEHQSDYRECSLCSLPFERYLLPDMSAVKEKNNSISASSLSLGCSLMSDMTLSTQSSDLDAKKSGWLSKGKMMLLKISRIVPTSLKLASEDLRQGIDPLRSFRIFDSDENYTTWKTFVVECTCTEMLAQALVVLLASIRRTKLPNWWSRKNAGWSTPYVIMLESNLSALYLHLYVLDAALSDIISRSLNEKSGTNHRTSTTNAIQIQKMKEYWGRALSQGYKAFEGEHNAKCYHCNDGGSLLCCELCPNVQHRECCDPKLSIDAKIEKWICDSCVNDIDNFDLDEDYYD